MKQLTLDKFEKGKPELGGSLPPLISDVEIAESVEDNSNWITEWIETLSSSNFVLGIIMGSSMASLWGMIRALQMVTLSGLTKVKMPIYLHIFM